MGEGACERWVWTWGQSYGLRSCDGGHGIASRLTGMHGCTDRAGRAHESSIKVFPWLRATLTGRLPRGSQSVQFILEQQEGGICICTLDDDALDIEHNVVCTRSLVNLCTVARMLAVTDFRHNLKSMVCRFLCCPRRYWLAQTSAFAGLASLVSERRRLYLCRR